MAFWDTSALVKLYVRERDSDYFRELMRASADTAVISQLSVAEMHRALWAKEVARAIPEHRAGTTYQRFRSNLERANFEVVPFGPDVEREFDRIIRICHRAKAVVAIHTFDCLLLASALVARTPELISTDSRMRNAASVLGLAVLPE